MSFYIYVINFIFLFLEAEQQLFREFLEMSHFHILIADMTALKDPAALEASIPVQSPRANS